MASPRLQAQTSPGPGLRDETLFLQHHRHRAVRCPEPHPGKRPASGFPAQLLRRAEMNLRFVWTCLMMGARRASEGWPALARRAPTILALLTLASAAQAAEIATNGSGSGARTDPATSRGKRDPAPADDVIIQKKDVVF